ncbi:MAG: prepilin-type N-terminal cleavage/methylation domain-containing protein [Planctomycetes bacterium]|nr:prepilin-type N-terminal cleavage/methylation domain-containing protein [Planctomycetota bacterium]
MRSKSTTPGSRPVERSFAGLRQQAFTLPELLVALGLGVMLLGMVAVIFNGSVDIMKVSGARSEIFGEARVMLDNLERDIGGMVPLSSGQQNFTLHNYNGNGQDSTAASPMPPSASAAEGASRSNPAGDKIQFRTSTTYYNNLASPPSSATIAAPAALRGVTQQGVVHVFYGLVPESDPNVSVTGDALSASGLAVSTQRTTYVLRRRVWLVSQLGPAGRLFPPSPFRTASPALPFFEDPAAPSTAEPIQTSDMGSFVFSMNISVLWHAPNTPYGMYLPIDYLGNVATTPANVFPNGPPFPPPYQGATITYPLTTPPAVLPRALRFTFRMTEGASERQERIVDRIFALPR